MTDRHARGRASLIPILLVFLLLMSTAAPVRADTLYNQSSIVIRASEAVFRSVELGAGDGMAGWVRILNGDGVHFFIVDSTGHNETQWSGTASVVYKEASYPFHEDKDWHYWNFTALYADVWYVYFSNTALTSYPNEDEVSIIISIETEPPVIVAPAISGNVSGVVSLPFTAIDDCFPIDRVELDVNGITHSIVFNEEDAAGVRFEGVIVLNATHFDSGIYTISLKAYDAFGRVSKPYVLGTVGIEPVGFVVYSMGVTPMVGLVTITALFLLLRFRLIRERRAYHRANNQSNVSKLSLHKSRALQNQE